MSYQELEGIVREFEKYISRGMRFDQLEIVSGKPIISGGRNAAGRCRYHYSTNERSGLFEIK